MFVMMVMKRTAMEHVLVSINIQTYLNSIHFIILSHQPQILMNVLKKQTCVNKTVPTHLVAITVAVVMDIMKADLTA